MKDFAMMIWNASSGDFIKYSVILIVFMLVLYEVKQEINIFRVKRFSRK